MVRFKCGCEFQEREDGGVAFIYCSVHGAAPDLLKAAQSVISVVQSMIRPFAEGGAGSLRVQATADQFGAAWQELKSAVAKATEERT